VPEIVIDARAVVAHRSGIGNYVEALIDHMVPLAPDVTFSLLCAPELRRPLAQGAPNVRRLTFPGETKSVKTVFSMGRAHPCAEAALYHSPADLIPLGLKAPYVVTIHDLMWVEARELASRFLPVRVANGIWYTWNIGRAVRGARRIISISQATADAIARIYPDVAHKVRVVRHGVDHERFDPKRVGPRSLIDDLVPPGCSYSMCVGQGSPYKNHARMLRAFVKAMQGRKEDHKLVLVRRFSRVDSEMSELLADPEVMRYVVPVTHVSDEQLLALYGHATMLLFASLYEGFGMPALEAMNLGLPVLGSSTPAVAEVVGDAALKPDPRDEDAIAAAISRLQGDAALRSTLREAGMARAKDFTWERAARETLAVYREAIELREAHA
jgi:glycosyltransferase involved in cell wall biosynthesis